MSYPFDISAKPPVRLKLLKLSDTEHILLLTMHHIIGDGWSIELALQEVGTLYQAYCNGEDAQLGDLPIQYVDYAAWQRQWLQGEVLETQLQYWKKRLEGAAPVLELPTDRPRPSVQ